MKYRIAILPSATVSKQAGRLGVKFSKMFPSYFAVDNKKLLPHVTLVVVEMSAKKRENMLNDVASLLAKEKQIPLTINKYENWEGWFSLRVNDSARLAKFRLRFSKILKKYGSVKQVTFKPHITLTKYKQEAHAKVATKTILKKQIKMTSEIVAVCLSNKYSQVYKVIKQYKLK